jgi:hypothetical protein
MKITNGNQFQETAIVRWGMTVILVLLTTFAILSWKFEYPLRISAKVRAQTMGGSISAKDVESVRNGGALILYDVPRPSDAVLVLPVSRVDYFLRSTAFSIDVGDQTFKAEVSRATVDTMLNVLMCQIQIECNSTPFQQTDINVPAYIIRNGLHPMENIFK